MRGIFNSSTLLKNIQNNRQRVLALREVLQLFGGFERVASIVVVTHNNATYLAYLLSSLEQQSVPSIFWDVIVVDRGSVDQTSQVFAQFSKRGLMRMRYHQTPADTTFGIAVNAGLAFADGAIVVLSFDQVVADRDFVLGHLIAHRAEPKLAIGVNTHALYTHVFCPLNAYMEGVQPVPALPQRDLRDIRRLKRLFVVENNPTDFSCISLQGEVLDIPKPWTIYRSLNASFLGAHGKKLAFDGTYLTMEAADTDFAFRAIHSGMKLVVATRAHSYRQMSPTKEYDVQLLRVDVGRLSGKYYTTAPRHEIVRDDWLKVPFA